MQRNLSYEAHLWYTLTSPDYVMQAKGILQDAFDVLMDCVKATPYIGDYPPVPYWGSVVEELLNSFDNALAMLKQGEYGEMMGWGGRLMQVPRGFDEGNMNWMQGRAEEFMSLLNKAGSYCSDYNRALVMSREYGSASYKDGTGDWRFEMPEDMGIEGNDIALYYEKYVFPNPPAELPEYAPDTSITCQTGDIVPWTGVWVPTTGMGTAALVFARKHVQIMQPSYEIVSRDADGYVDQYNLVHTTFHPVKPTGRMLPWPQPAAAAEPLERLRCEAGQPCPRTGWWWSPAGGEQGRQYFEQGQLLPNPIKANSNLGSMANISPNDDK
ncbi:hypothetical protein [Chitinivorax sp. B]|uniref:hypothetical protein n=1 Tax=Chitinivorax sp. B TaxID=2502235 RepID=UPI0010F823B5|nr:hypothetical protein [Chitinivorax sp. B]